MMSMLAHIFRSINSRLVSEDRYVVLKLLKISYGISAWLHKRGAGKKNDFIIINNFDRNLKLKVNTSWTMGFSIFWTGFHEMREFVFLNKFLKPEMVFIDVGANMGEYSLYAGKRLSKGKVLSFEPLPSMISLLKENIALNNLSVIQVCSYGLSDKEGILPFHELEEQNGHEGLSTFYPGKHKIKKVISAPLKVLDDEVETYNITRLDFIKLDIEGGELPALTGARKSILKFKPLVMVEINDDTYAAAGYRAQDIYDFFSALSYGPFEIDKSGVLWPAKKVERVKNIIFRPA